MITSHLYVVDASVILKWVFPAPQEADWEMALALLHCWVEGNCEFALPSLWLCEVGNIVGRNIPEKAPEIMEMLMEYRIPETPVTAAIAKRTLNLMAECGVTFYDAVYHALALERQGTLVTADEAYMKKAGKRGNAVLLADLEIR
jgi:predicted nucleic acid-binding protein